MRQSKLDMLLCLLVILLSSSALKCKALTEAKALIRWKSSLFNTESLSSWNLNNSTNHCHWFGITCNSAGSVIELNLPNCNLNGKLDELDFVALSNITKLDISNNMLIGSITGNISAISKLTSLDLSSNSFNETVPAEIGQLTNLVDLRLYNNKMIGELPYQLTHLPKVQHFDLSSNYLQTPDFSKFGAMPSLTYLSLSSNSFTLEFPSFILNCTNLTFIDLSQNHFSGPIPDSLATSLVKLQYLHLSSNSFQGLIPVSLANLKLRDLSLGSNILTGGIPLILGSISTLRVLELFNNSFSGPIPSTIGDLKNLQSLVLYENKLSGLVPPEIGNMTSLVQLDLSKNSFSGPIPSTVVNLKNLQSLFLYGNKVSGPVPPEIGNMTSLALLDLRVNSFSGPIPSTVGNLKNLQILFLYGNKLSGPAPPEIGNMTSLVQLDLGVNSFSGPIPSTVGNLKNLLVLWFDGNSLSGEIPKEFGNLTNLEDLILASNLLTGEIPPELLGYRSSISYLDLSGNKLSGQIAPELGYLSSLSYLDLSGNKLSGQIAPELGYLSFLSYLDLSGNKLSGQIAAELQNLSWLRLLNLSHNLLSGPIPSIIGGMVIIQKIDLSSNELSGIIPYNLASLWSLQQLNVSHNHLSGQIPKELSGIYTLHSIDFSYNQLTGPIPPGEVFQNASEAYVGNNGLCGDAFGLPSCGFNPFGQGSHKKHTTLLIIIAIPLAGCSLILVIIAIACRRQQSSKVSETENYPSVWDMGLKFKFTDVMEAIDNFNEAYCIGEGSFGVVYKAELPTGHVLAVKRQHFSDVSDIQEISVRSFINEIQILLEVRHRNIVKLHGSHIKKGVMYLVYDFVERGSLRDVLYSVLGGMMFDWAMRVKVIHGMAHALAYLHNDCSPAIVHRDISINNVLLDHDFEPKVSDFGTAKLLKHDGSSWTAVVGTYGYMAPELAYMTKFTDKCDVYSFGMVTLEVIMGMHPGELLLNLPSMLSSSEGNDLLLKDVLDNRLLPPTGQLAEQVVFIVKVALACTQTNPALRPAMLSIAQDLQEGSEKQGQNRALIRMTLYQQFTNVSASSG
ncbi:Non-specific serine/threonine protein kinase protein [Dioscorea alata]|uniref:Non-specific serine/threonine protein kinase protein n=1 Tax=Dioscorea alata TaxID=55571 RepID=A0ACB7WS93_DIOAL|nr:Non-specific serine/threonine protein kinase protein [Dioscorea alata]